MCNLANLFLFFKKCLLIPGGGRGRGGSSSFMLQFCYSYFYNNLFCVGRLIVNFIPRHSVNNVPIHTTSCSTRLTTISTATRACKLKLCCTLLYSPQLQFSCLAASRSAPACLSETVPHNAWWCSPRCLVTETHPTTWPIVSALFHVPSPARPVGVPHGQSRKRCLP